LRLDILYYPRYNINYERYILTVTMSVIQGQLMGVGTIIFLVVANAWVLIYDKYWLHPESKIVEDIEVTVKDEE
jgi:hypothetical protein